MEVVGQEAHADSARDDGDEGADAVLGEDAVRQARRVEEEGAGGDGDDARGQAVEPVDEVDRVRHPCHPHDADEGREIG